MARKGGGIKTVYPEAARTEAREIWLAGGKTHKEIGEFLSEKYGMKIPMIVVDAWARDEKWMENRGETRLAAIQKITTTERDKFLEKTKKHLGMFDKLADKAANSLHLENLEHPLTFETSLDAARTLQIGIEGTRKIQKGIVSVELLQAIYDILGEEIQDENVLTRIGARFKQLAAEFSE